MGEAYARIARLRFSSATRGRFCCGAGVEAKSSIAGDVNEDIVDRTLSAESGEGVTDTRRKRQGLKVAREGESPYRAVMEWVPRPRIPTGNCPLSIFGDIQFMQLR